MAFIIAKRISDSEGIDIFIKEPANFSAACELTDTDTGEVFVLENGKLTIPANDHLYKVVCTVSRVAEGGPPKLTMSFSQDGELLVLPGRANPTQVGSYQPSIGEVYVMRFTMFMSIG